MPENIHVIQKRDLLEMLAPFSDNDPIVVDVGTDFAARFRKLIEKAAHCDTDSVYEMQSIISQIQDVQIPEGVACINNAERREFNKRPSIHICIV